MNATLKETYRTVKEEFPHGTDPENAHFECHKCKQIRLGKDMVFGDPVDHSYERLQICQKHA